MRALAHQILHLPPLTASIAAAVLGTVVTVVVAMAIWPSSAREVQAPAQAEEARPRPNCAECGVVISMRAMRNAAAGDGSREVTVRMQDGSDYAFLASGAANWRTGARMILINGAGQSAE